MAWRAGSLAAPGGGFGSGCSSARAGGPRAAARRRLAVFGGDGSNLVDADLVNADVDLLHTEMTDPAAPTQARAEESAPAEGTELEQLAVLALRLEMAAAYLRLIGSRTASADSQGQYGGSY